jgi:hypothetical protein
VLVPVNTQTLKKNAISPAFSFPNRNSLACITASVLLLDKTNFFLPRKPLQKQRQQMSKTPLLYNLWCLFLFLPLCMEHFHLSASFFPLRLLPFCFLFRLILGNRENFTRAFCSLRPVAHKLPGRRKKKKRPPHCIHFPSFLLLSVLNWSFLRFRSPPPPLFYFTSPFGALLLTAYVCIFPSP